MRMALVASRELENSGADSWVPGATPTVALRMAARLRFAQGTERPTALFADLRLEGMGKAHYVLTELRDWLHLPTHDSVLSSWSDFMSGLSTF